MKKRLLIFFCVFLLLCGCAISSSQTQSAYLPEDVSEEEELTDRTVPDEVISRLMNGPIQIYEKYCDGEEFNHDDRLSTAGFRSYLFGWLTEAGMLENYAVYDGANAKQVAYYTIPRAQANGFCNLFFAQELSEDYISRFSSSRHLKTPPSSIRIVLDRAYVLKNGNLQIHIRRYMGDLEWYPAVYTFHETKMDRPLDLLTGVVSVGETVWQFSSMRNLPLKKIEISGEAISISTPEDLISLSQQVNSGDWTYRNNVYQLERDIDMKGVSFAPIGSYQARDLRDPSPTGFCAVFDGKGHTIKNLQITPPYGSAGLFATIGEQGMVSNLNLENCTVVGIALRHGEKAAPVGGIAGVVSGGSLQKCTVSGQIDGQGNPVGGLVGLVEKNSAIWNCTSRAQVLGSDMIGGLIGQASKSQIVNCFASGQVISTGLESPGIGGFIGFNESASIDHGIVSVAVYAPEDTQFAGSFAGYNGGKLISCFFNTDYATMWKAVGITQNSAKHIYDLTGLSGKELIETGVPIEESEDFL